MHHGPRSSSRYALAALALLPALAGAAAQPRFPMLQHTTGPRAELVPPPATDQPAAADNDTLSHVKEFPNSLWDGWKRSLELGINGSDGNSENFNLRAGFSLNRDGETWDSTNSAVYKRASDDGELSDNRFEVTTRQEVLFAIASRWRYFVQGSYEYDDFQDWDHRVTAGAGVGYGFIDNDATKLIGRVGLGGSRTWGGTETAWRFEGILGVDFEHRLSERTRLFVNSEYDPSLSDVPQFRLTNKAGVEILVDPELNISLKAGVDHRHDSNPGGDRKKNDIDYFLLLVWSF